MNFLIDYDTRIAECKCDDRATLEKYIKDNDLGMAVVVISEEDDILLEMSVAESVALYDNHCDLDCRAVGEGSSIASLCMEALNNDASIPTFTVKLGKKMLEAGDKRSKDKGDVTAGPTKKPSSKATSAPSKPKQSTETKVKRKPSYTGKTFAAGEVTPMKGRHTRLVAFVEDNLGEATAEELEEFLVEDGTAPTAHINYAIKNGFIEEV